MLLAAPSAGGRITDASDQPVLRVPGGAAGLARALGMPPDSPRSRLMLTAARLLWENPEGTDRESDSRRARVLEYLGRVEAAAPSSDAGAGDVVPSFIPPEAWAALLDAVFPGPSSVFARILGNRRASLLYHGLASLDRPTREYFLQHPDLLRQAAEEDRVGAFATFGRSLRVRGGTVEVPGGTEAAPLWEAVAGTRVADAAEFISRILAKDDGRLALLYDGVAHLDAGGQRFALGLNLPAPARVERFKAFYGAAGAALRTWRPRQRPFQREPTDAVHLLIVTKVSPGGELPGPAWTAFWQAVFDWLARPDQWPKPGASEDVRPLDAARVLELILVADAEERAHRSGMWLFAQRVFRRPAWESARDLLVAVRGFRDYPALLLTLERMGVVNPATYAAGVRAAERFEEADGRLWQFQAALAILDRARAARALEPPAADALVRKLCAITPESQAPYLGALARWLERDFLAAVAEPVVPPDLPHVKGPLELRLLAAMAGSVSSPANRTLLGLPPVEWEGLSYRVDPGLSTLQRLLQVRARQRGRPLDAVLALARLADSLANASSASAAIAAASELPAAAAALLQPAGVSARHRPRVEEPQVAALADRALEKARKLKPSPDPRALADMARPLQEAVDAYMAGVIGSVAYSAHLGGVDSPGLMAGDPADVHDFRFFTRGFELGRRAAWQTPVEARDADAGWFVSGALLCLDLAIGQFSLPRVPTETMPDAPTLSTLERQTLTDSALALTPFDLTDATRAAVLAAVDRGRRRVASVGPSSTAIEQLAADAGLDEWRAQALTWTRLHEAERLLESFSLAELARAGGLDPAAIDGLDSWGTSAFGRGGALAAQYPMAGTWATIAGRYGLRSAVAALVPDLVLGLAESSSKAGLPAPLTAGLVMVATQEFIDTVGVAHPDDWPAMVAFAQSLARSRLDEYVATLTIAGPLVPDTR